jgi:N-acetylglucosamine-6-phosphate deacetylase
MLVTDGLANVGTSKQTFDLLGATIRIENGVYVDQNGTLAGSALDMGQAVRNAMDYLNVSLPEALVMASAAPAAFLGLEKTHGRIAKGFRADFVVADAAMQVRQAWISGIPND